MFSNIATAQPIQEEPPGGGIVFFSLDINISPLTDTNGTYDGSFLITFDGLFPDAPDDGIGLANFYLTFDYYNSMSSTPAYSDNVTFNVISDSENMPNPAYISQNLRYHYIVSPPTCVGSPNNLSSVRITITSEVMFSTDTFIGNLNVNGTIDEIDKIETKTFDFPINNIYGGGLDIKVFPEVPAFYNCITGQTAYAVAFGGCPPYTYHWSDISGGTSMNLLGDIEYFDITLTPDNIFRNDNGTGATYYVWVEDAEGATSPIQHECHLWSILCGIN